MNESFLSAGDTASVQSQSSQGSRRLTGSLLQRIKAQREREAAAAASIPIDEINHHQPSLQLQPLTTQSGISGTSVEASPPTPQITVPNYSPTQRGNDHAELGRSSLFTSSWSGVGNEEQHQALLQPQIPREDDYTLSGYFNMFVMDVYDLFRSMPKILQLVVIVIMIYLAFKLLW